MDSQDQSQAGGGVAGFTPGPWRISPFEVETRGANRMVMGADNFSVAYVSGRSVAEHDADARLIAAAPDQHAALMGQRELTARIMKTLMAMGRRDDLLLADEVHRADDANRAAISKALGQ